MGNQVGLVRERFPAPRPKVKSYGELNALLVEKCVAYTKIAPIRSGQFDGSHALPASVSKTCLVRLDNNKYSVGAVGRPVCP